MCPVCGNSLDQISDKTIKKLIKEHKKFKKALKKISEMNYAESSWDSSNRRLQLAKEALAEEER
jgi:hypothetical protein